MKALWRGELLQVRETHGNVIELEYPEGDIVIALLSDEELIIDPTDDDLSVFPMLEP